MKKIVYLLKQNNKTKAMKIDQVILSQIMTMRPFKSKKEAINEALSEYLKNLLRQEVLKMKGTNCWEGNLEQMRID